jgi:hypothetical protein
MLQPSLGVSSLDLGRPPGRPLFVCVVGRSRISPEFVEEVAEWLSGAGVTLFFADTTYAVVKTSVVESWPRVTSKRIIRFPADHFGWTGLGHQWKFVPVRRSWLSSSMQRWAMTASRSASVAK